MFQDILDDRNAFLDYKNKKLKKSKNWDFSKGVSPWFWSKIGNFSRFLFQEKQARKVCFTIMYREETPLQSIETTIWKSRKIGIFPKGLVHGFGQKLAIFLDFYFRKHRPEKCFLPYCRRKNRLCRVQKQEFEKVEKLGFFPRGQSMVLVKNW